MDTCGIFIVNSTRENLFTPPTLNPIWSLLDSETGFGSYRFFPNAFGTKPVIDLITLLIRKYMLTFTQRKENSGSWSFPLSFSCKSLCESLPRHSTPGVPSSPGTPKVSSRVSPAPTISDSTVTPGSSSHGPRNSELHSLACHSFSYGLYPFCLCPNTFAWTFYLDFLWFLNPFFNEDTIFWPHFLLIAHGKRTHSILGLEQAAQHPLWESLTLSEDATWPRDCLHVRTLWFHRFSSAEEYYW